MLSFNQRKIIFLAFFGTSTVASAQLVHEFPDLIIYAEPPLPNAPGSIRGNCYGAPCPAPRNNGSASDGRSNIAPKNNPAPRGGVPPNPQSSSGSTLESISGKQFMDFVRGINPKGIDDPRVAGLMGSGSGYGSASFAPDPSIQTVNTLQQMFSRSVLAPPSLSDPFLNEMQNYFAQNQTRERPPRLILPPLPTSSDVAAIAKDVASKAAAAGKGKWQNPDAAYDQFSKVAQAHASKELRAGLERIEVALKPIYQSGGALVSRVTGGTWPEIELATRTIIADISSMAPKKNVDVPRVAKSYMAATASELFRRNYVLLPQTSLLRDALEIAGPDGVALDAIREPAANRRIATTYKRIDKFIPTTPQGRLGRLLAEHFAISANREYLYGGPENEARAEGMRQTAEQILDLVSGFVPVVGPARDIYELYIGENLITGVELTPIDRAILLVSVASLGLAKWAPRPAINATINSVKDFSSRLRLPWNNRLATEGSRIAEQLAGFGQRWPELVAKLRAAAAPAHTYVDGKSIPFTVGKVSSVEMDILGRAWVGGDATKLYENGQTFYISRDRLTQYRPPDFKRKEQSLRANLEKRFKPEGPWISNAHFDIE